MKVSDFDYELPDEAIARHPAAERDASRLLVVKPGTPLEHRRFLELPDLLDPRDLLVLNDTKVLPARLRAHKAATGGKVEVLLVEPEGERWLAMVNASKPVRAGATLALDADPTVELNVIEERGEGFVLVELPDAQTIAHRFGEMPLPPYLRRAAEAEDRERYQTVFARAEHERSVAAPTAGLHFTPRVFERLRVRGIEHTYLTLHVGPGTFLPVRVDDVDEHRMHAEHYVLSNETAQQIEDARKRGGRIIAVGTTVTRVLESIGSPVRPARGSTDLFIKPGFHFQVVDAMVTNFHLPRSTLLMLVSALAGRERILEAYREALRVGYRFFSYGDASLLFRSDHSE